MKKGSNKRGCLLSVIVVILAGVLLLNRYLLNSNDPTRILLRNQQRIEDYVDSIYAGRVPLRDPNNGYQIPGFLLEKGVSYVRNEEGCVVITFSFMPTDPVPELIYSPAGIDGLPARFKSDPSKLSFFELKHITDRWFYCEWDL
jgi:hypothetical protein